MSFKIEILKSPTKEDWQWAKTCTLNTVGKTSTKEPSEEWKMKLLKSEHSPIRELWFGIKMEIPYYVSTHLVRHHIGVNHYISTQRDDRNNNIIPREEKPQGALVSHIMSINAQELIFLAHRRLCNQADPTTREVVKEICKQVIAVNPEFKDFLVPMCEYLHSCNEFNPCGRINKIKIEGREL